MAAPYKFIVEQVKETHELYQKWAKHNSELDQNEVAQKHKIEKLYNLILELETENNQKNNYFS